MPVEACSEKPPLSSVGMPQQNSITSSPRATSPSASESDLAVLGREQPREVLAVLVEELADAEEELGAARERERAPGGRTPPSRPATARSISSAEAKSTAPVCTPVAGL